MHAFQLAFVMLCLLELTINVLYVVNILIFFILCSHFFVYFLGKTLSIKRYDMKLDVCFPLLVLLQYHREQHTT